MTVFIAAGFNWYYVIAIVVAAALCGYFIVSKQNKSKNRSKLLDEFRRMNFSSEDELSWYIAHDMMGAGGFPDCVVYKVDPADRVCRQVAAFGPKNPDKMSILNPINIPFSRGIVGHVAESGKIEKIDDATSDPRYVPDDDVRYSELTVPVVLSGICVMVIDSEHKNPSWFKEADVDFVKEIAMITAEQLIRTSAV